MPDIFDEISDADLGTKRDVFDQIESESKTKAGFFTSFARSANAPFRATSGGFQIPLASDKELSDHLQDEFTNSQKEGEPTTLGKVGEVAGGLAGSLSEWLLTAAATRSKAGPIGAFAAAGAYDEFRRAGLKALAQGKTPEEAVGIAKKAAVGGATVGGATAAFLPQAKLSGARETLKTALKMGGVAGGGQVVENLGEQKLGLNTPWYENLAMNAGMQTALPFLGLAYYKTKAAFRPKAAPVVETTVEPETRAERLLRPPAFEMPAGPKRPKPAPEPLGPPKTIDEIQRFLNNYGIQEALDVPSPEKRASQGVPVVIGEQTIPRGELILPEKFMEQESRSDALQKALSEAKDEPSKLAVQQQINDLELERQQLLKDFEGEYPPTAEQLGTFQSRASVPEISDVTYRAEPERLPQAEQPPEQTREPAQVLPVEQTEAEFPLGRRTEGIPMPQKRAAQESPVIIGEQSIPRQLSQAETPPSGTVEAVEGGTKKNVPLTPSTGEQFPTVPSEFRGTPLKTAKQKGMIVGTALEEWADRVMNEDPRKKGRLGLDPVEEVRRLAAAAVKGAALLEQGVRDFASWSKRMINDHGTWIKPHLDSIYRRSQNYYERKSAGASRTEPTTNEPATESGRDWVATIKGVAGNTLPKITAKAREVGEAGARYISSKIAAPYKSLMFTSRVLASGVDANKLGAALTEDNLRSIKQDFIKEGNTEAANAVESLIGSNKSPFKTESEYQEFLRDPKTQDAIQRHKQLWEQEIDPQYKMAQGIDADVDLPSRGLQTGARINLKALLENEGGTRVVTAGRGSLLSTFKRKSPFARHAKGTGERYETDYNEIIANTYARQLEIANQNHFTRMLLEHGLASVGPKAPTTVAGEAPSRAYPLQHRIILSNGKRFAKNENLYLPKSLEEEYRAAVNVDAPGRVPGLQPFLNVLNKASILSIGEFTGHMWNLADAALNLPKGNLLRDALLKVSGRADVIPTMFSILKKSLSNNTEQLSKLAEIGALRENFGGVATGKVITWFDKTVRLILDDAYQQLAKNGVVENTETARREYINQVGQYNKRAQGPLMRWLRDTGVGPFATAGRAFNVLGVRRLALSPGVKAGSIGAAIALRANMLGGIVGMFVLRGVLNYMLSGKVNGREGTRLMDIDLGTDDKNGKPLRFPVGDLLGPGRGLRVTGIGGAVESKRAGLGTGDTIESGLKQISSAVLSPGWGPGERFASTVLLGRPTVFSPQTAPTARPEQSQRLINLATAAKEANPFIATGADIVQGEGTNPQKLLGRISPLPGMTSEKYAALPEIVKHSKLRDYKEYLVHEANKLAPDKRGEFLDKHSEGVEFSVNDLREIRRRTRR